MQQVLANNEDLVVILSSNSAKGSRNNINRPLNHSTGTLQVQPSQPRPTYFKIFIDTWMWQPQGTQLQL